MLFLRLQHESWIVIFPRFGVHKITYLNYSAFILQILRREIWSIQSSEVSHEHYSICLAFKRADFFALYPPTPFPSHPWRLSIGSDLLPFVPYHRLTHSHSLFNPKHSSTSKNRHFNPEDDMFFQNFVIRLRVYTVQIPEAQQNTQTFSTLYIKYIKLTHKQLKGVWWSEVSTYVNVFLGQGQQSNAHTTGHSSAKFSQHSVTLISGEALRVTFPLRRTF